MANMHQVMSNLWIGDYASSQDATELTKLGITHIVCASASRKERLRKMARS